MIRPVFTVTPNPALDVSSEVEVVRPDVKLRCAAPRVEPGGGGVNVTRVLATLGVRAPALLLAGGRTGAAVVDSLRAEGHTCDATPVPGETRQSFTVGESASGQQFRFVLPGPAVPGPAWQALRARLVEHLAAVASGSAAGAAPPAIVVLSGSFPPGSPEDAIASVVEVVGACDPAALVVVDTSGPGLIAAVGDGPHACARPIGLLKLNLRELAEATGSGALVGPAVIAAATALRERGRAAAVLVTRGAAGALLVDGDGAAEFPAPVVPVRSRVGAGDSTVAGIVAALARGSSLRAAVADGVLVGAAAVMTPGTELVRLADLQMLRSGCAAAAPDPGSAP